MGLYDHWPYTNFHELNLSWLLRLMEDLSNKVDNFVALNTIKYADPIQWNITTQYEANTVVVDPQSGTAYISSRPVPAGVALTNTDYWNVIFTLDMLSANDNITLRDDGSNVLSTFASNEGDWLLWNGNLYRVSQTINLNEAYVVGYNLDRYTVELFIKDYVNEITTMIGDLNNLSTTDKDNLVDAINEIVNNIGDLGNLITIDTSSLVAAINEIKTDIIYATPEQYGAVGDGITDDTQAIQNAIDNNNYVIGNGNYAFTSITINGSNKIVEFNGELKHIGTTSNFTVDTTTAFTGITTVDTWANDYNVINKYAVKLSGRWCRLKINKISTTQTNTVAILLKPEGVDTLVDHCNVNAQWIVNGFSCGIMLYAEEHQNVQYNSISVRQSEGSISSIALIASQSDGYVNANYFHDSQIQTGGIDLLFQNLDSDYATDNWFEHLSFEGVSRPNTVRCYNLRNGGFKDFRYEEVATIPMTFIDCTKILLNAFTYFVYSTSLSLTNCTEIIFKGFITIAGGSRLVDEDVSSWKYVSQNVNANDTLGDLAGITGNITRFGNIVEAYIIGTAAITIPANGSYQIGTYTDRYMSQHDDIYFPLPDNPALSIRFKTRAITVVNNSASALTVTLKPQIFRWLSNRIFV